MSLCTRRSPRKQTQPLRGRSRQQGQSSSSPPLLGAPQERCCHPPRALLTLRPRPSKSRGCLLGHCSQSRWAGFPEGNKKREALPVSSRDQKREIKSLHWQSSTQQGGNCFQEAAVLIHSPDRQRVLFEVSCSSFLCPSFLLRRTGTNNTTACVVETDG